MQFRAVCSKGNQKLTLSISANGLAEARAILHGQGYSIMEIHEMSTPESHGNENFFYFDSIINGNLQTGKIQSEDIFKAYRKLVDDLGYNIKYIYTDEGMPEDQRIGITMKVRDLYVLYKQSIGDNVSKKDSGNKKDEDDEYAISPQVLKEIARYNGIIDSTIEKIQNLIIKYHGTIDSGKKSDLEQIEISLVQLKGMSNVGKMKSTVESALLSIGAIEENLIKLGIEGDKKKISSDTNALLKQIGSASRVNTTDNSIDIGKKISGFLEKLEQKTEQNAEAKNKVDTKSFVFYKNLRELSIYREGLKKTDKEILLHIVHFQFSKLKRLFLKKKLLKQNIQIIDNRIHNKSISYTKIIKGTEYYSELFFEAIQKIADILLYSLFLYTFFTFFLESLDSFGLISLSYQEHFFFFIALLSIFIFLVLFFRSLFSIFVGMLVFFVAFIFLFFNF